MHLAFVSVLCAMILLIKPSFSSNSMSAGDIIILAGTSSSGKSTIAKAIMALDPERHEDDLDLRLSPHLPRPPEMQEIMMDDVMDRALSGEKMLVHLDQGGKFLKRLEERNIFIPVRSILVFCRFLELPNRINARNQSSNDEEWRDPLVPLDQYGNLYTISRSRTEENGLETLEISAMCKTYSAQFDAMIAYARKLGNDLPSEAQIKEDKERSLVEFLINMDMKKDDVGIMIRPKNSEYYTLVVDNSHSNNSQIIAELILKAPVL